MCAGPAHPGTPSCQGPPSVVAGPRNPGGHLVGDAGRGPRAGVRQPVPHVSSFPSEGHRGVVARRADIGVLLQRCRPAGSRQDPLSPSVQSRPQGPPEFTPRCPSGSLFLLVFCRGNRGLPDSSPQKLGEQRGAPLGGQCWEVGGGPGSPEPRSHTLTSCSLRKRFYFQLAQEKWLICCRGSG